MAEARLRSGFIEGYQFMVEFDIANFFGESYHTGSEALGSTLIGGCWLWAVPASGMPAGTLTARDKGTPQGALLTPPTQLATSALRCR